mgnify:CR=1 FL=1
MIDITIAWKTEVGHVEERDVGHDADKKAADKERKHKAAMKRQLRGLPGWLANVRLEVGQFVPLAYEACGSWGQHAMDFFNFVKRCAGSEGTRAAELYHWSAMTCGGGHWRRRMAVEIGRGRVNCLGRSADPGYKGNSRNSAEAAPYTLR